MGVSEIRWLRQLGEDNSKLKRLVSDLMLDKAVLQDAFREAVKPARRREAVRHYREAVALTEIRACRAMCFWRTSHRYRCRRYRR